MPKELSALPVTQLFSAGAAIARNNRFVEEGGAPLVARHAVNAPFIAYRKFKWPGSREGASGNGILANVDAYREMRERDGFSKLYTNMAWVRNFVLQGSTQPVSLRQVIEMTSIGETLPLFLLRDSQSPFDPDSRITEAQLPETMADMYKSFRGLFTASINLAIDSYDSQTKIHNLDVPSPSAEEIYNFVDRINPKLVNAGGIGCPAPKDVIVNAFNILLTGKDTLGNLFSDSTSDIPNLLQMQGGQERVREFAGIMVDYEFLVSRLRRIGNEGQQNLQIMGIDTREMPVSIFFTARALGDEITEAGQILLDLGLKQLQANTVLGRLFRRGYSPAVSPEDVL